VPAFGGDLVAHPPDFFKKFVFHRPSASFRHESENSRTACEAKAQLGRLSVRHPPERVAGLGGPARLRIL
jgi:hypothetical protein